MAGNMFIFGSCVTRDAFEFIANDYTLRGYISRSSLGSAFAEKPFDHSLEQLDPEGAMVSAFQKRMVQIDLQKDMARDISALGPADTMIVDLIDERFDLLVSNDTLATCSFELSKLKPTERYRHITCIRTNTDQHFDLWMQGMRRFANQIRKQGPRIILNKAQWAETDVWGVRFSLADLHEQNAYLQSLYQAFCNELDCLTIEYRNPFISDPDHKWGRAPFHYTKETYTEFMSRLAEITAAG